MLTTFAALGASIKSEKTSTIYQYALKGYMSFRKVNSLSELLEVDKSPKLIQASIIEYLVFLKQVRNTSYSYRNVQLAGIKHFYRMNEVELNWFTVSKYLGEHIKIVKDRAYSTEEIQLLLTKADERMRVVILLLASTGIRLGAIPKLNISDLTKIEKYNLYQLSIYANSEEEYYCFCTPEAASAIDSYLAYRERYGEKLNPKSPLIREQFNVFELDKIHNPKGISDKTIGTFLQNLLARSGIVTVVPRLEGTTYRGRDRKVVARAHGFRKFCTTNMIRSKLNPEAREMLLGHSIGLSNSYYRPDTNEILDEYIKAVDLLTINEENRLKRQVKTLTARSNDLDEIKTKLIDLETFKEKIFKELVPAKGTPLAKDILVKLVDEESKVSG